MNYFIRVITLIISIYLVTLHVYAQTRMRYTPAEVLAFRRISQVVPSDDGKQVAFTIYQVKSTNFGKQWEYSLYLKNSKSELEFLDKANNISSVNWSPNNKLISYLAKGNKFQSIWIYDILNRKNKKLIEFKNDISSFKWSPDGKNIAFTASEIKPKLTEALTPIDVSKDFTNTRLYIFDINAKSLKALIPDKFSVSQFFVYPGFDWSPDSQSIAFSYQSEPGEAHALENKIGIINLNSQEIKTLPYSETHNSTQPAYSLDGKWIAFQASPTSNEVAVAIKYVKSKEPSPLLLARSKINRICVSNLSFQETHCLADTFNQDPIMLGWNRSSDQVLVFDPFYKTEGPKIYSLNLNPLTSPTLISDVPGFIEPLTISFNNQHTMLGFGYETVSDAPQAFISNIEPFKLEQVSHFQTQNKSLGKIESIKWTSSDGFSIEGLLITPPNYNAKKKYPLLVSVHGGPASAWSKRYLGGCDEYKTMLDPTTCWGNLLSLGFIILQPNPRGSDGYGAQFRLANFADLGGGDYRDVIAGVDYLINKGIADANHLAIVGWSYGGYLSAWSISQTNRFKAAVDGDGNTNWISYAGTSGQPLFAAGYFGSEFWNNDALYIQRSTVMQVKNITTPLLIMHGENDIWQVPITQSKELYTDLDEQKKKVKMLILPQQGHVPTDANIIYKCIEEIDNWLKQAL